MSTSETADGRRDTGILTVTSFTADDDRIVARLSGELDLGTVPVFVDAVDELLTTQGVVIELDMSELGFIDSSGIGAYVTAHRRAKSNGSQLYIGERSELVQRVLQLSGVEEALAAEAEDS